MSPQNIPPKQLKKLRRILISTALCFILASTCILAFINTATEILGNDAQLYAYIGLFVGIADIITALFIFRTKEEK